LQTDLNKLKRNTARLSVISNTSLVVLKLVVGICSGAVSIISEAAHSGVDLMASVIDYYAVTKAGKPPDERHEYGHGKIENLSAVVEAGLIILAALWIVYEAVGKIAHPSEPEYLEYGIAVMLVSIILNILVSGKMYKVAKKTGSPALEADALHLRADVWTSVGVLVGLTVIKVTGLYWLDPVIAIVVAVIVFHAGYTMTKKSVYELTDSSWSTEEEAIVQEVVNRHPETITVHNIRTRHSGSWRLVDMHVTLKKDTHLDEAHSICDQLEADIKSRIEHCDVVIHLEPCDYHETCDICPLASIDHKCKGIKAKG